MLLVMQGYEKKERVDSKGNRTGIEILIKLDENNRTFEISEEEAEIAAKAVEEHRKQKCQDNTVEKVETERESVPHITDLDFKEKFVLLFISKIDSDECKLKDVKNIDRSKGCRWVTNSLIKKTINKVNAGNGNGKIAPRKVIPIIEKAGITYEGAVNELNDRVSKLGAVPHTPKSSTGDEWAEEGFSIRDYAETFDMSWNAAYNQIRKHGIRTRVGYEDRVIIPKKDSIGDL